MVSLLFQALYFFLPVYCANMAPTLVKWLPFLNKPISEKYFGSHKTWRGLIVATLVGGLVFAVQRYVHILGFESFSIIDYGDFSLMLGFLMGAGAILGDLVKSYYKRKENIAPGERWVPFDQLDFVVGGIVGTMFVYVPNIEVVVILLVASPLLHIIVNHVGFWIGVREGKW